MKKLISIILSVVTIFTIMVPAVFAAELCDCNETPIIYVRGRASVVEEPGQPNQHELPYLEDGQAEQLAKDLLPLFFEAYTTGDYSKWAQEFLAAYSDIYASYRLDENGEITNNSGIQWSWSEETLRDIHKRDKNIAYDTPEECSDFIYRYFFQYDCRRSPLDIADDLNEYIDAVKKVTGHTKVKILTRCLGTTITAAYFTKYGYDDIEAVVIYNPIMNGTLVTNTSFTGDFYFNDDSLNYFANQELGDDTILQFVKATLTLMNETYALKIPVHEMNRVMDKIKPLVVPQCMKLSYGSMPGYWAMVTPDKYEQAKDFVFSAEGDKEKYAKLIAKNDEYYEKVSKNINTLFKDMEKAGVHVSIIAKYGLQPYPISKDATSQSDQIITVEQQAMGTYCAPIGSKLSDSYLKQAEEKGTAKYISSDRIVDASTGLFPDTTWYIKNLDHNNFPEVVDELIYHILTDDITVWDDPEWPQFMLYTGEKHKEDAISPLTAENNGPEHQKPRFIQAILNFFRTLINLIKQLFNK